MIKSFQVLLILIVAGCTQITRAADKTPATGPATAPAATVAIDNFTFTPMTLTIAAGTQVTWTNHDDIPHTATSNTKVFASKALDTDDTFSFTFTKPGIYPYYCAVHPHMTGQIIVK